ncbi:MAG: aminotransferase class I/II-fold pyridoxal phosphate-dependent enzyme, partial [Nitrososphaerota archaeon]
FFGGGEKWLANLRLTIPSALAVGQHTLFAMGAREAVHAVRHRNYMHRAVESIVAERERIHRILSRIRYLEVYPSQANFLLIRLREFDAGQVYSELLRRGIVVRNFSQNPYIKNSLRVTVGTKGQNNRFLAALRSILDSLRR